VNLSGKHDSMCFHFSVNFLKTRNERRGGQVTTLNKLRVIHDGAVFISFGGLRIDV
jgi:hypothetical protein